MVFKDKGQCSKMQSSPLMFETDEEDNDEIDDSVNSSNKENAEESIDCVTEPSKEERILKGFQTVMMGIPPPPAFTVPQLDCREILKLWRENQSYRVTLSPGKCENNRHTSKKLEEEAHNTKWPDTLQLDYWDVYYNKTAASEELERLSVRYKERYVGAETSSCINALFAKSPHHTASARKRARHRAWGHSPGRRLSHLARRRKAFSSASLCSVAGNNNPDKKMIMVEIKKIGNRKFGQKKKGSVKKTKPTPKKKNEVQASTFKRALFQSPDQDPMNAASKTPNTQCIQRSKRNLFADSSEKKNEFGKRERPAPKRVSPRKRVNRSLSFQESSQPSTPPRVAPPAVPPAVAMQQPSAQRLSGAHKQKMLWATTNALREEGMGMSHELFRTCMTVLFHTCQRLWTNGAADAGLVGAGSTSERMLALAKRFCSYTIREVSSDPTSEHMALVYNNSLKMAEKMLNQPSSSGVTSTATSEKQTSDVSGRKKVKSDCSTLTMVESENKASVIESKCNVNVQPEHSSVVTKVENTTGSKAETPCKSKHENASEVCNLVLSKTQTGQIKNTPSKASLRDSVRSSPRLARKTPVNSNVKSSVCNNLFPSKASEQTCENTGKVVDTSLTVENPNKDCSVALERKTDKTSPLVEKSDLDPLTKEVCHSLKKTPLKCSVTVVDILKKSCTSTESDKLDSSKSLVGNSINSALKTQCNSKPTSSKSDKNFAMSSVETLQTHFNTNLVEGETNNRCVGNNNSHLQTVESSPQNKTPKKVSFSTDSPSRRSCSDEVVSHCDKNESFDSPRRTNSILKKTAVSVNINVTESCGGRRITRSVSTDTQAKKNKTIHHLFSPPTTFRNNVHISNKSLSNDISKQSDKKIEPRISEAKETPPVEDEALEIEGRRVTRRLSHDLKMKTSPSLVSVTDRNIEVDHKDTLSNSKSDLVEMKNDSELSKRCLKSHKSPKKKTVCRRISQDTNSSGSVISTVSTSSSQNSTVENTLMSPPEFVSPRTRLRKSKSNVKTNKPSKPTPDKLARSPEVTSPETKLRKATLNKRTSIISSDASPSKDTPVGSVFSEDYSADPESSNETLTCQSEKSFGGKSNNLVEKVSNEDSETNKENLGAARSVSGFTDKNVENRQTGHRHLTSVENTPVSQVVPEEPVSRMLQLYRLSSSGGDNMETEKLLPDVVCLDPPTLMPHWAANDYESEESVSPQKSPPSLIPHWEQESCSGTSTSLPESIMAHWQQLSAQANDESSDKVMFDFEDTSYEITFPSANEDSRASSICAPFDFPLLVDDSKSCFNNVFRRGSNEPTDQ